MNTNFTTRPGAIMLKKHVTYITYTRIVQNAFAISMNKIFK